ncbi:MAG: lipopolysaccharide biosynthesis protein [Bacteroidota bacterium]
MSAIRKLASQTAVYGLSSIIGRIAVWGLTPIYTARLEPGEYGVFGDLYSIVTYFLVILTFGMETSFFRFSSDDKTDKRPYTQALLFVGGLATIFLVIFGFGHQGLASALGYGERSGLVLMVVFIIYLDVMVALPMAKLRYDERPIVFATISLVSIFLNIGLNLWFILGQGEKSAEYVFIANLIASGFKLSLLVFFSLPFTDRLKQLGRIGAKLGSINVLPENLILHRGMMRSMAAFGFYIMLAGLFGMINQYSDINFVKRLWPADGADYAGEWITGAAMAGILFANKKLAVFILLVTQAFRYAAEPFFFRQARESDSKGVFAKVFHYFMLAALGVFLLVSVFAREFVNIKIAGFQIIDEQYHLGLEVVPLLLFAFVLWGAYINISIWFKLTKQVRFGLLFSGAGVITILLFFVILIPFYGYMGAATAMLLCYLVMCALCYRVGQTYYPIPYRIGRTGIYMAIILTAFFTCRSLGGELVFAGPFWGKLLICLAAFGLIAAIERLRPIDWEAGAISDGTPTDKA